MRGDHIYVKRPIGYTHHGIDCGDGTVIHFTGEPGKPKLEASVARTSLVEFLDKGELRIVRYGARDDADVTMNRAESKLGTSGYNVLGNNCEHFAAWCITGRTVSEQVRTGVATGAHAAGVGATVAGTSGVIAGLGVAQGLSAAGIMSGLATAGGTVGAGAAAGPAVLGAGPALLSVVITRIALADDERLPDDQRAARKDGRIAAPVGAAAATAGGLAALSSAGAVSGLSAAGISSGLAAIGGGTMIGGAAVLVAAPAVAAAALGFGVYRLSKWLRAPAPTVPALPESAVAEDVERGLVEHADRATGQVPGRVQVDRLDPAGSAT